MADIIVTTPKREMANAAAEAAACIADGGGRYFRVFQRRPPTEIGDRVYYVEDGYVRGYALVESIQAPEDEASRCATTGRVWRGRVRIVMNATSWVWIRPIPYKGFQGWRYWRKPVTERVEVLGGWRDPKPEVGA